MNLQIVVKVVSIINQQTTETRVELIEHKLFILKINDPGLFLFILYLYNEAFFV